MSERKRRKPKLPIDKEINLLDAEANADRAKANNKRAEVDLIRAQEEKDKKFRVNPLHLLAGLIIGVCILILVVTVVNK